MQLIPQPKKYTESTGTFCLSGKDFSADATFDSRVMHALSRLCDKVNSLSDTKGYIKLGTTSPISIIKVDTGDSYTISVTLDSITIKGGDTGAFYGIETILQAIKLCDGATIPCFEIEDTPDFTVRGFYHDVTRGRVPTLDTLKELVDSIAMYKVNQFQLYIEDAFAFRELEGVMSAEEVLHPCEIVELDDYCHDRFIELVPSVASFGHLYNQLQAPNYKHCCEYVDYKPHQHYWLEKMSHHTVDIASDAAFDLVCSRIDQFAALCRSDKFNICCDETYDLCRGKNEGKDTATEYFNFVLKLVDHVKKLGKTVMMWGDIVLHYPDKIALLPDDTIMLNWGYSKEPDENTIKTFAESGKPQYVCPSTNAWNRYLEETGIGHDNISLMAEYGHKYGSLGYLNTNWGDYGNVCAPGAERYGMVLGCERAWNASSAPLSADWKQSFSKLEFFPERVLSDCPDIVELIFAASECEENNRWMEFVPWFSANYIEDRDIPFEIDTTACPDKIAKCEQLLDTLLSYKGTSQNYTDLALAFEAIIMMNHFNLHFGGKEATLDVAKYTEWLDRYSAAWLDRCKSSQLYVLQDFLKLVLSK